MEEIIRRRAGDYVGKSAFLKSTDVGNTDRFFMGVLGFGEWRSSAAVKSGAIVHEADRN